MAAAEARAAWQRMANRCFVQEDAKRAPKLACCQSSSSASKQVDAGSTNTVEELDHPALCFMPLDRNSFSSNLPPESVSHGGEQQIKMNWSPWSFRSHTAISRTVISPLHKKCMLGDAHMLILGVLSVDHDEALASSFDWKVQTGDISNWNHAQGCPGSGKTHGKQGTLSEEGYSLLGSNKSFSYCRNHKDTQCSDVDPGKAELMEALCHSQTRASQAETTVKWVCAEKEHILKFFF